MINKREEKVMNKKKKGFTLIELIVVIAILGILAAVAVPRLSGFQDKAKISADKATYDTISKSISIAVANQDISGDTTVVITSAASTGAITVKVGGTDNTTLIESGASFKLDNNKSHTFTWTITAGSVSAPGINASTGVIKAD